MNGSIDRLAYVLITPARNESAFIEKTIQSVVSQTWLPERWVIVDDGSTDDTADIVRRYLLDYPWMELVCRPARKERHFAGKVEAFREGHARTRTISYEVLGNLDGDVSFGPDYLEFLICKFMENPRLGVAGTIFEEEGYHSGTDSFEGRSHVPGQCQMFRTSCYEEIGGYTAHRAGGIDWIAVTKARMKGWTTESFKERSFFHHRRLGTAERGLVASAFAYGQKDYCLGGHPLWELFRVAYRMTKKPYMIAGAALGLGYFCNFIRQIPRPVGDEFIRFHRSEQMKKLRKILSAVIRFKRLDRFEISSV